MGVFQAVPIVLGPWQFMANSAFYLPGTVLRLLYRRQWSALVRWHRFQAAWFGRFWQWAGPFVRTAGQTVVVPLLHGRVRHGRLLDEGEKKKTAPPVSGTVIEVGPGSGMWVSAFTDIGVAAAKPSSRSGSGSGSGGGSSKSGARQRKGSGSASTGGGITKIYGVEPNPDVHASLRHNIAAAGLDGVYEIVPTGIEHLADAAKVAKGSVDCVVSVLCLCGIPEPQRNIRELYTYLKPGGRMYVYEHVCCTRHWTIKLYQRFLNLFWPLFLGGCQLRRDTGRYLREAGNWTSVDLCTPVNEPWYQPLPHIVGILTK